VSNELLFGVILGGAWALREVLPLLFKRFGNGKPELDYLPKDADARREAEWWDWRRGTVNKRLDAHAEQFKSLYEDISDIKERIARIERNGH
jgi:hypothetical protein